MPEKNVVGRVASKVFDNAEIVAFRGCNGDPKGPFEETHCIWKEQTCKRCEELAPAHYWKDYGKWNKLNVKVQEEG